MTISMAGLAGAALALAFGLWNYRIVVSALERRLRALDHSESAQEREVFEGKLVLMRRIIFWIDMVAFPPVGYTVGALLAG